MKRFLVFILVVVVARVAAGRYLHQIPPSPLLPSSPITQADPPILINAPVAESRKEIC